MKKRIARIVVYFGLLCLSVLVLSHPYIWQSIFGPTIKGEPLWAWQQEFRYKFHFKHTDTSWRTKALTFLGVDSKPTSWVGYYPRKDPELVPVLLSLVDDGDEHVRGWVAHELGSVPPTEQTVAAIIRMLDDPSLGVMESAIGSCGRIGPPAGAAVPKLRAIIQHVDLVFKVEAAHSLIKIGGPAPELLAIVREGLQSNDHIIRIIAVQRLNLKTTGDEEIFGILLEKSRNDPKAAVRHESIYQLHKYGTKAVPHLIGLMQEPSKTEQRFRAIGALGWMGSDAKSSIAAVEVYLDDPDEEIRARARRTLKLIDPQRAATK